MSYITASMIRQILRFSFFVFFLISPKLWAGSVLDSDFGQEGKVIKSIQGGQTDRGEVIALDSKDRVYVAGMTGVGDQTDFFIARYQPGGSLDLTYGQNGITIADLGGGDHVHGLVVAPDGLAYISGYSVRKDKAVAVLFSVNPDGTPNLAFGQKGQVITDLGEWAEIHYMGLTSDKKIVVTGFVRNNNDADIFLVRYLFDGQIDSSFGDKGRVILDWTKKDQAFGLALTKNIYYITGSVLNAATKEDCVVGAFDADGVRLKDFGFGGLALVSFGNYQDVCSSITLQKTGQILVAGYVGDKSGLNPNYAIARLNTQGVLDTKFGNNGKVSIDFDGGIDVVHAIDISGSDIILTGESEITTSKGTTARFSLARLDASGNLVTGWGEKGRTNFAFGDNNSEQAMGAVVDKKGDLFVVGHAEKNMALAKVSLKSPKKED